MQCREDHLISVIIPVYNVEVYLEQCLDSVCNQNYKNIEIIIINDGSVDNSEHICKTWSKKDSRIRYFQQENIGLGPTRNRGIDLAMGKYITFIDSDDWVSKEYIKNLYSKLLTENADISYCNFQEYDEQNKKFKLTISHIESNSLNDHRLQLPPHIWGRLYNIDLFNQYGIKMPPIPYEDLATYPILTILAGKIAYVDKPLYCYRINTGKSIMDNLHNVRNYPKVLNHLVKEFKRLNLFHEYKEQLMKIMLESMKFGLQSIRRVWKEKQYKEMISLFRESLDKNFCNWRKIYENKIWVWGSYNLSRLADNLMFEYDICDKETTYYGFSSIISLMSDNYNLFEGIHTNPFRLNMLSRDINKSFKTTEIKENDYILIDFLEERYDILKIGGTYITKSEALEQSPYNMDKAIIKRDSEECYRLWEKCCLSFIEFLKEKFDIEKIILVEMYLCEKYVDGDEKKYYISNDISSINGMLTHYYSFFKRNFPNVSVIQIPEKLNYTDGSFKYGCKPYYLNHIALKEMAKHIVNKKLV